MSKRTFSGYLTLATFALLLTGFPAHAQEESDDAAAADNESDMEVINVVGIRNPNRSLTDSTVSVEVIGADQLQANGSLDLLDQLANEIPSLHLERFPIADAATLIRPPNLRGLPSDATLVLVNGKRRHRGAVIALLGGGKNQGAHGPDISAIPTIALDRVEVLRDGAAAQYGSDAIAGVVNFVLRETAEQRTLRARYGQYLAGDGVTTGFSGILGLPLTDNGFVTLSAEMNNLGATTRSVQRDDALGLIAALNQDVRQPFTQIWGSPNVDDDLRFFANAAMPLSESHTLYAFGNYSVREVEGGFFYRHPARRAGVFTADGGQTLLFADLRPDDGISCPPVPFVNGQRPDPDSLEITVATEGCVSFLSIFPGGFTPQFGGDILDLSLVTGLRGQIFNDWDFDASIGWGYNGVAYYMTNTINPQLIGRGLAVPTEYKPGEHEEQDMVLNYQMSKLISVASGYGDMYFATGFEYRTENFVTTQGDENSWIVLPEIAAQGFGIGSNGFPGFPPSSEVDESRASWALWADAEQDLTSNILGSLAVRFESYEDFGTTLDFKAATRIEFTSNFSVRGAYSTGFAAPTVGQSNIRIVATNYLISPICPNPSQPCLADEVTLAPTDPLSILKGGQALQPVRSRDISIGIAYNKGGFDWVVDYFRINVDDRIARTSPIPVTPNDFDALEERGETVDRNLSAIRFYTNDFDTRTEGLELSVGKGVNWGLWQSDFTFAASYVKTSVEHFNPLIINAQRIREMEEGVPRLRFTLSANHQVTRMWSGMTRIRYYGELWEPHVFSSVFPIDVEPAFLADVEIHFTPDKRTKVAFGFENIFDTYPTENPWSGAVGAEYPITSAFGFNGGFAYVRLTLDR